MAIERLTGGFQSFGINLFKGLNLAIAPELIDDSEARKLLNFRTEKVGKLVTRNGYIFGLFLNLAGTKFNNQVNPQNPIGEFDPTKVSNIDMQNGAHKCYVGYPLNLGIVGIGEYRLEDFWNEIDTNRLMVYAIIHPEINPDLPELNLDDTEEERKRKYDKIRNRLEFLFAPLTGKYKDVILDSFYLFWGRQQNSYWGQLYDLSLNDNFYYPSSSCELEAMNLSTTWFSPKKRLLAPRRTLLGNTKLSQYINGLETTFRNEILNCFEDEIHKQFITMKQYRNWLVISDPINGDMLLEDDYDFQDEFVKEKRHFLRLRPNCLHDFNVDIVNIDLRLNEGEENDVNKGVETGMALYKFELPTNITKKTVDVFDPTITDGDFLEYEPSNDSKTWIREYKVVDYVINRKPTTLITAFARSMLTKTSASLLPDDYCYSFLIRINNNYQRIFTNVNETVQFKDLLGELQFVEDEEVIKSEDDKDILSKKKVKSANVYIWEDFKIKYYPSRYGNRKDWDKYLFLFRKLDRPYSKSYEKIPRIINLNEPRDFTPVNGWYYKFVWDFGNGFYSAPSRPIAVPDIMWSAVKDEELLDVDEPNNWDKYYRNYNQQGVQENSNFASTSWLFPKDRSLSLFSIPPDDDVYNYGDFLFSIEQNPAAPFLNNYHPLFLKRLRIFSDFRLLKITDPNTGEVNYKWQIKLTNYGNILWRLKRKLYYGTRNRFGDIPGYYFDIDYEDCDFENDFMVRVNQEPLSLMSVVDFVTLITCFFGGRDVATRGTAWQYVKLNAEKWTVQDEDEDISAPVDDSLEFDIGPILIPIFYHPDVPQSRFALFDNEGRLRLNWLSPNTLWDKDNEMRLCFNKFFSFPWAMDICPRLTNPRRVPPIISFTLYRKPYFSWMNLYIFFYSDIDYNNLPATYFLPSSLPIYIANNFQEEGVVFAKAPFDNSYLYYWFRYVLRPTNGIRAVRNENSSDRMFVVGKNIPNEVKDRLILKGLCEIQVVKPTDKIAPWFYRQGILNNYGFATFYYENTSHKHKVINSPIEYNFDLRNLSYNAFGGPRFWDTAYSYSNREYPFYDFYIVPNFANANNDDNSINGFILASPFSGTQANLNEGLSVITLGNKRGEGGGKVFNYLFMIENLAFPANGARWFWTGSRNKIINQEISYNVVYGSVFEDKRTPGSYKECCLTNLDITIYGEGERLTAPEQLSAIFPSSLLFKAPRLAIRIKGEDVPLKAKKLLVFRTKSTIDNYFNPDQYGLVKEIDILRPDENNPTYIETKTKDENGNEKVFSNEIYFFDNITDDNLDFSVSPDNYEGLRKNIRSSFNLPLNERVYYYNFEEDYQPETPRKIETPTTFSQFLPNIAISYRKINSKMGFEFTAPSQTKKYGIAYEDENGIISRIKSFELVVTPDEELKDKDFYEVILLFSSIPYNPVVKLIVLRQEDNEWYKIGEIKTENNGIFVDNNKPLLRKIHHDNPITMKYPTGLRWSEPYRPDWIKEDSFTEYKGGRLGTGLEENYGNLVLFTENSMARYTVQAIDPPISRVDEITPEVGCIAPKTLINQDNNLFFLSHKGWMHYNNNIIKNIDEKIHPELQTILYSLNKWIKYSTTGFNPAFSEFYLNLPLLKSDNLNIIIDNIFEDKIDLNANIPFFGSRINDFYYDYGIINYYEKKYPVWGNIYVQNLLIGYSTKFSYVTTLIVDDKSYNLYRRPLKVVEHPLGNTRLYFTNTLGELRSADLVPNSYPSIFRPNFNLNNPVNWYWAGIYIETPSPTSVFKIPLYLLWTKSSQGNWFHSWVERNYIDEDVIPLPPIALPLWTRDEIYYDFSTYSDTLMNPVRFIFPIPRYTPIRWIFFSKFFSQNDESGLKRVRKVIANIYTKGNFAINLQNFHREEYDNNIEEVNSPNRWLNLFFFNPSEDYYEMYTNREFVGRNQSVLSVINNIPIIRVSPFGNRPPNLNDFIAKPMKTSIEFYGRKRAQLNEIEINWRGIHQYLM